MLRSISINTKLLGSSHEVTNISIKEKTIFDIYNKIIIVELL